MESILAASYQVAFENTAVESLKALIAENNYSSIFILVDENTKKDCLPYFNSLIDITYSGILEVVSGEVNKTIASCVQLWEALSEKGADRQSLLINLGGGVITDMGGFVASTFKRGIDFVNVPSTLLSMVDASVGGKTGVDLGALKNQVGVINEPQLVLVLPELLKTLDERQTRSGFAEILKHGLISNKRYWETIVENRAFKSVATIRTSIGIKNDIVLVDLTEKGPRKKLNFGHTLGHAVESYCLENPNRETLLHGEAIAVGMILEAFIATQLTDLPKSELVEISNTFTSIFGKVEFSENDITEILDLLKHDKKNTHGKVKFVLLKNIGEALIDIEVSHGILTQAFAYYREI